MCGQTVTEEEHRLSHVSGSGRHGKARLNGRSSLAGNGEARPSRGEAYPSRGEDCPSRGEAFPSRSEACPSSKVRPSSRTSSTGNGEACPSRSEEACPSRGEARLSSMACPSSRTSPACNEASSSSTRPCSRKLDRDSRHWHFQTSCYNSNGHGSQGVCLADQSVSAAKCRHIVCLLLAYLAMAASAEASSSRYTEPYSAMPNLTVTQQNRLFPDDTTTNIPLPESHFLPEADHSSGVMDGAVSSTLQDMTSASEIDTNKEQQKPGTLIPPSSQDDITKIITEKSRDFILNIFHRYSKNNYMLKTDLEKLFVNLGLSNRSNIVSFNVGEGDEHGHDETEHNHHELNKNTRGGDLRIAGGETGDDHAADMLASDHTSRDEDVQHKPSNNSERTESLTNLTSVTRGRQRRGMSHQQHDDDEYNKCLSKDELLSLFRYDKLKLLNADEFRHLCPALIDQLDAGYCRQSGSSQVTIDLNQRVENPSRNHQHDHSHGEEKGDHQHTDDHDHQHTDVHEHDHKNTVEGVPAAVWTYALLSVTIISLCSVAGVVVIPNMKRVFYNHILQFLVALAVGAMSGDAILHLFPHAMLSESHDHHRHKTADSNTTHSHEDADSHEKSSHMAGLYKGLVALLGIYSFFFLERLFTLFTSNRSGRREKKQKPRRRCHQQHQERNQEFHMVNSRLENDGGNTPSCDEMVMVVHPNKALRAYADVSHEAYLHRCDESLAQPPSGYSVTTVLSHGEDCGSKGSNTGLLPFNAGGVGAAALDAEIVGINKDAQTVAATHSHSHSHLAQDFVGPLSSVAMMVIVGDMIHNLCDGLAIGAAYAGNVAGGLSTSVAVFCHELPHEIGDFAVLVRSGLTMRKAVYFNLISSIPCFIGVIIGLTVGNVMATSSWIFAGVGGMFLYVTLVDLIPEMSSVYTKCGEPWFLHLLLQASGIAVGTTIMLIISIYEETLLAAFN